MPRRTGYVKEDTRQTMFNNDLVIVTKEGGDLAGQDISLEDIAAGKYTLAVGDENVPAGNYACQSLTTVGSYIEPDGATGADATGKGGEFSATLQPKVTLGGKVGDVCKYAESGEVDIAMVYTSDVYRMGGVVHLLGGSQRHPQGHYLSGRGMHRQQERRDGTGLPPVVHDRRGRQPDLGEVGLRARPELRHSR